jgi:hypothetical protein
MRPLIVSLLLAALILALPVGLTTSARSQQTDVATIEVYARGLDGYVNRNARAARYFADTGSMTDDANMNAAPRWQEFRTRKALDNAWQNGKTYSSSNVWFNATGDLVVAVFTFSSPSGDWVQYVTNYYRKDGTLAKSSAELRTFMGDVIRINDRLYDSRGKLLKEQTRFLDLKTRRPKRVGKSDYMEMESPLYKTTSALPFYGLLKKR